MSAKPEDKDKEQRKSVQTTPLEINMAPPLGDKEDTAKKDIADEKSIEESDSNSPRDKRPSNNPQQKHSTGVATTVPTTAPTPAPALSLAPAPTPLWKGITGMISNTVSKVFGAPREGFESGSDTGEPSHSPPKPKPKPKPVPAVAKALKTLSEIDLEDEIALKQKRHEAARAYALGLGEDEKAYYASTVAVPAKLPPVPAAKLPDHPKPKRKVFTSPRASQPQTEAERHHAARAFALGGVVSAPATATAPIVHHQHHPTDRDPAKTSEDGATGNHSNSQRAAGVPSGIIWPPPTRLLNLKLDDFAKRAGQSQSSANTNTTQQQIPSVPSPPKKTKPPPPPPPPRFPASKAASATAAAVPTTGAATGIPVRLHKQKQVQVAPPPAPSAAAVIKTAVVKQKQARKPKYAALAALKQQGLPMPVRPSLTVTTVFNKEYGPTKSTVIASTGGAAVMGNTGTGTGNNGVGVGVGVGTAPTTSSGATRRDQAAPVFPTTLKTQVMSAASTVARSLNIGPWPSPHLSLEAGGSGGGGGTVERSGGSGGGATTTKASSSLHSQHMSVVAASIQQFAYDVILRSMELEIPDKANESKAFLGTMLILREVLTQNGEGIFGSLSSLTDIDTMDMDIDSKDSSSGGNNNEQNQEAKILSHQVLATSVILAGLEAFQGPWSEKLSTDFLCMIDGYDNDSDEVAEYMVAVDQNTAVTLSGGREMSAEERLAWQLSTNLHRDDHPVIKRKWEIENAETSWKARKIEVATPNACHISILEEACRD